jgi:hypothetical protein
VLQKVKRAFDPTDTMNPGKLVSMEPPPDQQAASS